MEAALNESAEQLANSAFDVFVRSGRVLDGLKLEMVSGA